MLPKVNLLKRALPDPGSIIAAKKAQHLGTDEVWLRARLRIR